MANVGFGRVERPRVMTNVLRREEDSKGQTSADKRKQKENSLVSSPDAKTDRSRIMVPLLTRPKSLSKIKDQLLVASESCSSSAETR
jgi:hypothetical protein